MTKPLRRDFLDRPISEAQDAFDRWQARVRLWDIEDAGGWQEVCARMDEPKPPLHQLWTEVVPSRRAHYRRVKEK